MIGPAGLIRIIIHAVFLRPFLRLFFGLNISGRENFDGLESFVLVANHNSHLDVALLFSAVPLRFIPKMRAVAALDYFGKSRLVQWILKPLVNPVWIRRGGSAQESVESMKETLRRGGSLIVFPEGTRGQPGEMQRFRSGIGMVIAEVEGAALVPAYLSGPEKALPKGTLMPIPVWNSVAIGPPLAVRGKPGDIARAAESAVRDLESVETAGRHRRVARREKGAFSVAVLGIDGSGKSTVSRRLAESESRSASTAWLSDKFELFEAGRPRETQPLITEAVRVMIGRSAKKMGSLRLYKVPKLAEMMLRNRMLEEIDRWFSPDLIVLDGSPLLNLAAWSVLYHGDISGEECALALRALAGEESSEEMEPVLRKYPELRAIRRLGLAGFRRPDAVVMLDLPAKEAVERIEARSKETQPHETAESLDKLAGAYKIVCGVAEGKMGIPTLTINALDPLETIIGRAEEFVRRRS